MSRWSCILINKTGKEHTENMRFCRRGFRTNGERVGWKNDVVGRERAYAAKDWCTLPERIVEAAERLRGVQIEHMDAVELIKRFNH